MKYLIPEHWALHIAADVIGITYEEVIMLMASGNLNPYNTASVMRVYGSLRFRDQRHFLSQPTI